MNAPLINVGASKEAIDAARATILEILDASCEEKTKVKALEALTKLCGVEYTTITGNSFYGSSEKA